MTTQNPQNLPVGILGIGVYLPPTIRKNDWWPESVVDSWKAKPSTNPARPEARGEELPSESAKKVVDCMSKFHDQPFKGAVERRVMSQDMEASEMEVLAGKEALERAGVSPSEIDLLLVYSALPDYITIPNHPKVHLGLGLPKTCFTMGTESACNSFMAQMEVATQMIRSGSVRKALLVQSTALTRVMRTEDHFSPWFGDLATAVVVGPVREGRGVLSSSHRTDGTFFKAVVTGCPGKHWYEGQPHFHTADPAAARRMLLVIGDLGKEVVDDALHQAGLTAAQVDFYATHQSTLWFREVTQEIMGLTNARSVDTFAWTASVAASSAPLMMALGEREGILGDGHVVAMYSGGGGLTYSGSILRWGR